MKPQVTPFQPKFETHNSNIILIKNQTKISQLLLIHIPKFNKIYTDKTIFYYQNPDKLQFLKSTPHPHLYLGKNPQNANFLNWQQRFDSVCKHHSFW